MLKLNPIFGRELIFMTTGGASSLLFSSNRLEIVEALLVVLGLGVALVAARIAAGLHACHEVLPEAVAAAAATPVSKARHHFCEVIERNGSRSGNDTKRKLIKKTSINRFLQRDLLIRRITLREWKKSN